MKRAKKASIFTVYYGRVADMTFSSIEAANEYVECWVKNYPRSYKVKEGFSISINNYAGNLLPK